MVDNEDNLLDPGVGGGGEKMGRGPEQTFSQEEIQVGRKTGKTYCKFRAISKFWCSLLIFLLLITFQSPRIDIPCILYRFYHCVK